ncbi:hypothetical protein [Ramlibacter montanisoli]|uniref:Lipoprotein n=1 Tax=Ramlibacter montanisoli TaxID=2732512 RepID=A0A849KHB0_9BURK|nr:hypothetical protein [Ramlibacter montanisoli]NNU44826.1 hypothetical protein [Ramlibacter montanisoli]
MHVRATIAIAAALLAAGCSRTEAPAPQPPVAAAPAPAAAAAPAPAPAPQRPALSLDALSAQAWRVTESKAVAAGSLYVFLPGGTLLVATPGSTIARGRWRAEGAGIVMEEDSLSYRVDLLELHERRLRLRSHNPGAPVDMTLEAIEAAAQPVPATFQGAWGADRKACGQPGAESRLVLDAGSVRLHESSGKVLAAVADPRNARQLDLVLRLRGEGGTRLAWRRLRLAQEGATLTDLTDNAQGGLARVRCP